MTGDAKVAKPGSVVELRKLARLANEAAGAPMKKCTTRPGRGKKLFNVGHYFIRNGRWGYAFCHVDDCAGASTAVFVAEIGEELAVQIRAFIAGARAGRANFSAQF